uniref:Uncharacterized protein n=1 Tax=Oryza rufipogon TaxID=4529 RepID=A0A0E0QLX8_ORYRU
MVFSFQVPVSIPIPIPLPARTSPPDWPCRPPGKDGLVASMLGSSAAALDPPTPMASVRGSGALRHPRHASGNLRWSEGSRGSRHEPWRKLIETLGEEAERISHRWYLLLLLPPLLLLLLCRITSSRFLGPDGNKDSSDDELRGHGRLLLIWEKRVP